MKTFTRTYLEFISHWKQDSHSAQLFCDWLDENGWVHSTYTESWRKWAIFSGVGGFIGELHRLANAESEYIEAGHRRAARRKVAT